MPFKLSSEFSRAGDGLARIVLQVEMKRRDIKYEDLLTMLNMMGAKENIKNLRNKVARGTFSAGFFVMCMLAMGATEVKLDLDRKMLASLGIE